MQQIDETTNWEIDEAVLVIEQAKDKVSQILERAQRRKIADLVQIAKAREEAEKLRGNIQHEAQVVIDRAHEEAGRIIESANGTVDGKAKEEASRIIAEATQKTEQQAKQIEKEARKAADDESATIIARARKEAEQITHKVEEIARKKSVGKAEEEAQYIIEEAKATAGGIVSKAHYEAKSMWEDIKANMDKQSERLRDEMIEEARTEAAETIKKAEEESAKIISEAKRKAKHAIDILNSTE